MHPAFSVIFFSTLTGLGYGLWIWLVVQFFGGVFERHIAGVGPFAVAWLAAMIFVAAGLLSSTMHLGRPLRAWRAFSQWRTSWLSREGVAAVAAFVPGGLIAAVFFVPAVSDLLQPYWYDVAPVALVATALLSALTILCTAMIYASLKPVPAWRHAAVVPVYFSFALLTGGLLLQAFLSLFPPLGDSPAISFSLLLLAVALMVLKRRYWRNIDRSDLPSARSSALRLPADRVATVFERPHTEASYLTKEMGFVVARKHSARLRALALLLFGWIPVAACALALLWPPLGAPLLAVAALSAMLGALVERWLFFAEAKHLVTLYY